ncbi:MAG: hypothetical protein PHI90_03745 [Clostridia bacterium]|nr:hypothetical protein [Clostridia bacterium]MDD4047931.1 hypothetical protein [Clostridia bacterium]
MGVFVFGALVMLFKMEEGELAKRLLLRRVSRKWKIIFMNFTIMPKSYIINK